MGNGLLCDENADHLAGPIFSILFCNIEQKVELLRQGVSWNGFVDHQAATNRSEVTSISQAESYKRRH